MRRTTIEEELMRSGRCLLQTVGSSMEPLLHERSTTVVIERCKEAPQRGDVVLFRFCEESDAMYVLHRVIAKRGNIYRTRGDHCIRCESVPQEKILGRMKGYFDGEAYVDCETDAGYRRYLRGLGARYVGNWGRTLFQYLQRRVKD